MNKLWYKSKTLWANAIAIIGILGWGAEFPPETVATVLVVINTILRFITKDEIAWSAKK